MTAKPGPPQRRTRRTLYLVSAITVLTAGALTASHHPSRPSLAAIPVAIPLASSEDSRAAATSAIATASPIPLNHRPGQDISWRHTAGRTLPISASAGPAQLTTHQARGFAPTTDGAALAAAHLLQHTQPSAGSAVFTPPSPSRLFPYPDVPPPGNSWRSPAEHPPPAAGRRPQRPDGRVPPTTASARHVTTDQEHHDRSGRRRRLHPARAAERVHRAAPLAPRGLADDPAPAGTWTPRRTSTADRALTAYNRLGPTGGAS